MISIKLFRWAGFASLVGIAAVPNSACLPSGVITDSSDLAAIEHTFTFQGQETSGRVAEYYVENGTTNRKLVVSLGPSTHHSIGYFQIKNSHHQFRTQFMVRLGKPVALDYKEEFTYLNVIELQETNPSALVEPKELLPEVWLNQLRLRHGLLVTMPKSKLASPEQKAEFTALDYTHGPATPWLDESSGVNR